MSFPAIHFPLFTHYYIQLFQQRLQRFLKSLPDHVDLGVVGDGLEGDVGDALVHEPLADVVVGGCFRGDLTGERGFLDLADAAVGEQVVRVTGAHDAGAGQSEGHAGSVDGDPAAAPLLGNVGGGSRAAGGVEDEVAGISGHENASLDNYARCSLYYISLSDQ